MTKYVISVAPTQFDTIPNSVLQLENFAHEIIEYSKQVCDLFPSDQVLAKFDYSIRNSIQPNPTESLEKSDVSQES